MKTAELIGVDLDYWVSKAEDQNFSIDYLKIYGISYSTEWSYGGPIIEREQISVLRDYERNADLTDTETYISNEAWYAEYPLNPERGQHGPTPLIAAMRVFVASKFGDEIDKEE